jgi:micrococcal nuclease
MNRTVLAIILIAANVHGTPASAQKSSKLAERQPSEWLGTVTRVSDGDTLWVRPETKGARPVKIRLTGIDAPESCQTFGTQSRESLQRRIDEQPLGASGKKREVRVERLRSDDYGRALSRVYVRDSANGALNTDVAAMQVRSGMAWSYSFRRDPGPYIEQEREARAKRRGLFSDPAALNPREFRKRNGPCEGGLVGEKK